MFKLTDNLIGHWKLNDAAANTDVLDSGSKNNDGTFTDATGNPYTSQHTGEGLVRTGLMFDGDDDYIDCGINNLSLSAASLCAWVKPSGGYSSDEDESYAMVEYGYYDMDNRALLYFDSYSGKIKFVIQNWGNRLIASNADSFNQQWYFVVGTFNSSAVLLYIDKVLQTDQGAGKTLGITPNKCSIGVSQCDWQAGRYFNGNIDNVMIFDKALSQLEVTWLYNGGKGREYVAGGEFAGGVNRGVKRGVFRGVALC